MKAVRLSEKMEYEVMIPVPDEFQFYGPVPYDMEICAGTAFVKINAYSIEEATQLAKDYFAGPYSD